MVIRVADSAGRVAREGTCTAEFFAPGKPPSGTPDHSEPAEWDQAARGFLTWVDTDGWEPGQWTVQGKVRAQTARGVARGISDPFPLLLRPLRNRDWRGFDLRQDSGLR